MQNKTLDTVDEAVQYIKSEFPGNYVDFETAKIIVSCLLEPFLKDESTSDKKFGVETKEDYRVMIRHYSSNITSLWRRTEKKLEINQKELSAQEIGEMFAVYYFGYSKIAPLMADPQITDIHVLGHDRIFYEKGDLAYQYNPDLCFSQEEYKKFLEKDLERASKTLNAGESKKTDFELYGNRYNAKDVSISPASASMIIRKHAEQKDQISNDQLIDSKIITCAASKFLATGIAGEFNMVVGGITGSGKTTLIRGVLNNAFKPLMKKVYVIEDTPELFLDYEFMECLVTVKGSNPYTISDAIQDALRSKPRYIVISEIRGPEIVDGIEAGATGHSTIFTGHYASCRQFINRTMLKYIERLKVGPDEATAMICETVDVIVFINNIPGVGRRTEIFHCGYNHKNKEPIFTPIFEYNVLTDQYYFRNGIPLDLAKMLIMRGAKKEDVLNNCYPDHQREKAKTLMESGNTNLADIDISELNEPMVNLKNHSNLLAKPLLNNELAEAPPIQKTKQELCLSGSSPFI